MQRERDRDMMTLHDVIVHCIYVYICIHIYICIYREREICRRSSCQAPGLSPPPEPSPSFCSTNNKKKKNTYCH